MGQEVVTCRYDASKDLVSPCRGDVSYGEVKIEKTDGSSSEKYDLPVFVHGSITGQKESGLENGIMNKERRG